MLLPATFFGDGLASVGGERSASVGGGVSRG
jgi:hypothetical protein